jgi:hypothetical protein
MLSGVQARSLTVSTCHSAREETIPALAKLIGSKISGIGVPSRTNKVGVGVAVGIGVGVRVNIGVGLTVALGTRVIANVRVGSGIGVPVLDVGLMIEQALKTRINRKVKDSLTNNAFIKPLYFTGLPSPTMCLPPRNF